MENITISKIFVNTTSKAGTPFKNGDVMVSVTDTQGRKMSSFLRAGHPLTQYKAGDTFQAQLSESNGFLNFKLAEVQGPVTASYPTPGAPLSQQPTQMDRIEQKLDEILSRMTGIVSEDIAPADEVKKAIPF